MKKKRCFVIMPISTMKFHSAEKWTEIYESRIKPAVEQSGLGYQCERSQPLTESIIKNILQDLSTANVVIADLTENNPNVLYELGVRHTLARTGNATILVAESVEQIPFYFKSYPVLSYGTSVPEFQDFVKRIKARLEDIERNPDKIDNPVGDFLKGKNIALLSYEKSANSKRLAALLSEFSSNIEAVELLFDGVQKSQLSRAMKKGSVILPIRLQNSCLDLLLSESYINLNDKNLVETLWSANSAILWTNARLDQWGQPSFASAVEQSLLQALPEFKQVLEGLYRTLGKIRVDYVTDNYQEQPSPTIVFAKPEHQQYIPST